MASLFFCFVPVLCSVLVCKHIFFFLASWLLVCSLFAAVCIYIFITCSFPLDYFSPSLPLQAAVAATANTSTVTTATAGTPGAPGAHSQGAPGSPSLGPASHNVPSVNEGTDWTDGYHLGEISQPYYFTYLCLWRCFLALSFLPFFCCSICSFSPSPLYFYFHSPFLFLFLVCSLYFSISWCHHNS